MSGPKRGTWHIVYDPKPQRLADLSAFASGQTAWLERNGSFIGRFLGDAALARVQAAHDLVQQCIERGDPDSGFDAYGQAWDLFHQLHREAVEAKRLEHLRQRQEAEARERRWHQEQVRRQQEAEARRRLQQQEQLRRQQAAAEAVSQCHEAWQTPEHQTLLGQWIDSGEQSRLESDLRSASTGTPEQVMRKVSAWQERFEQALRTAGRRAEGNSKAVAATARHLRAAMQSLGQLNTLVLSDVHRKQFDDLKAQLHKDATTALSAEDLPALRVAVLQLNELAVEFGPKVKAAELKKAAGIWRDALAKCGYSVSVRTGPDGGLILEASSFPMKSLNVEVRPDSPEVRLEVSGKHDHTRCVKDVQALQAELARQGMELRMTDWGRGKPAGTEAQLAPRLSIGGAR